MTEPNAAVADSGPTEVNVNVHLGDEPARYDRLGDWDDGNAVSTVRPFVGVRVGDSLTIMTGRPDYLDQLAGCLVDAARALRTLHQTGHPADLGNGAS